jgi:7-cyano-7-deazaguanine tRNA-ribosyltransferase
MGEHRQNFLADGRHLKQHSMVMDSQINYYESDKPRLPYRYKKLFLDNGAFTALRKKVKLDPERVKQVQEALHPDKTIPLDFPFRTGLSTNLMMGNWDKTKKNICDWQETTSLRELVPALHAWSVKSLRTNVKWLQRNADANFVAVGSIVLSSAFGSYTFFGDRNLSKSYIDMLLQAIMQIRSQSDFGIHMMGFGSSPLLLNLGYFCGITSTDSAGYRRGAAYGKIILPGKGWRYIGKLDESFHTPKLTREEKRILLKCKCQTCRQDQGLLRKDWKARAVHNKFVLEMERDRAKRLIEQGRDSYEAYLDSMFERLPRMRNIWKYTKTRINSLGLDHLLP